MSRKGTLLVIVLLGTIAALATTLVVSARGGGGPPPPKPVIDQSVLERTIPSLSAKQRQQVNDVVLGDSRVQQFAQGQAVQVADLAVWTKSSGELIGAVATVGLARPAAMEGEWLALDYDANEATSPPYRSVPYRLKYSNVTSLMVFVDLGLGQVVGVTPDHKARAEGTPQVPENATPMGGSD